jgi:hypothetical protein
MWYLDNCANNHTCGDKQKFMKLNESIRGNVTFVDHLRISIKQKYMILIKLKNGSHQFISNIYYISIVKSKILSLRQLLENSYLILVKCVWRRNNHPPRSGFSGIIWVKRTMNYFPLSVKKGE